MELTEKIDSINKQLADLFGIDTVTGQAMWRVVWSEEQFEHRYGTYEDRTASGLFIREVTEVRYVPKYRQWIQERYVLEHLIGVPEINKDDLPSTKTSYEPLHVFEDAKGNYLPPHLEATKFIINLVHAAQFGTRDLARYASDENSTEAMLELQKQRVDNIVEELFGEQSGLQGMTKTGEAVIVPRNYMTSKEVN